MKKLFVALLFGTFFLFVANSCNKTCTCQGWTNGIAVGEPYKIELTKDDAKKCKDKGTVVEVNGLKTGIECK